MIPFFGARDVQSLSFEFPGSFLIELPNDSSHVDRSAAVNDRSPIDGNDVKMQRQKFVQEVNVLNALDIL